MSGLPSPDGPGAAAPELRPAAPTLHLLIVDDEAPARLRLRHLIDEVRASGAQPVPLVVGEAATAAAALATLTPEAAAGAATDPPESAVDAVLLDIGLPGLNGLGLAAALRRLPRPPAVVFVTAHAEHALQAFELQAIDYLTKPVRRERLQQALARVAQWRRGANVSEPLPSEPEASVLVLHERGRVLRLPHAEIVSLRAEHKSVLVRTASQSFVVDESLNDLEQRLGEGFVRVHRSALVARRAIRALELRPGLEEEGGGDGWAVWVAVPGVGGEWLAVSRRQVATVKAALAAAAGNA